MVRILLTYAFSLIIFCHFLEAQTSRDVSVEVSAVIENNPLSIVLMWPQNDATTQYQIYRKDKNAAGWGSVRATLQGSVNSYKDNSIEAGKSYEYRINRTGQGFTGYGYILCGVGVELSDYRGRLILAIDSTITKTLAFEIKRLISDMEGDGWDVVTIETARDDQPSDVKLKITEIFNQDKVNTKALFILGHVPVPYSGNLNPDGHPDHQGAWPADVYYADVDGAWTDISVNNIVAGDQRNRNVPGDGKFDQSILPSNVELQVGRIDLANMPAFKESETELVRKYLDKDHAYRHKKFNVVKRGVIDDNFGYFSGEAFAASGWRNFGPLVGSDNVIVDDYFTAMSAQSYQWSYGCGGGTYTSAGGIGSTDNFKVSDLKGVFTMLFGSYFGDWDSQNNFLRAPLAQGVTLTNAWAGRPHWYFHHMGLGENIGYSVRQTQNNSSLYYTHYAGRFIHIALMGDLTLRNDVVGPVKTPHVTADGYNAKINWSKADDITDGYNIYVKKPGSKYFERINKWLITDTSYIDSCLLKNGHYIYMIKSVRTETTPSGSYINQSQGITDTLFNYNVPEIAVKADYSINNNWVSFFIKAANADQFRWYFSDGTFSTEENPKHLFTFGPHGAILVASNSCKSDTILIKFNITTGTYDILDDNVFQISPNPNSGIFNVVTEGFKNNEIKVEIINQYGAVVFTSMVNSPPGIIDAGTLKPGVYFVKITDDVCKEIQKVVICK